MPDARFRRAIAGLVLAAALVRGAGLAEDAAAPRAAGSPARAPEQHPPAEEESRGVRDAHQLPEKVVLPDFGIHRAPRILRLAGRLTGLPVRVETKELNDTPVEIPLRLARRHVSLGELRVILAAHSIFLFIWDHPEEGKMVVAASRADWQPPPVRYRAVLKVGKRIFAEAERLVAEEVERRNENLAPTRQRYVSVPVARLGKIFLWGPSRRGLEEILDAACKLAPLDVPLPGLHTYKVLNWRAERLLRPLEERLSEAERQASSFAAGSWGNVIIYRADDALAAKIERILVDLDKPHRTPPEEWTQKEGGDAKPAAGAEAPPQPEPGGDAKPAAGAETPAEQPASASRAFQPASAELRGVSIDLEPGEVPLGECLAFLAGYSGRPVLLEGGPEDPAAAAIPVAVRIRDVDDEVIEALLASRGWIVTRKTLPGGREVILVAPLAQSAPPVPTERRILIAP
ncbi:MAG: hypothetical protein JXA90_03370 [Planctomycetes bacterium]|nr:hypothetical protein [Planctomycetota bacterium]